MLDMELPSLDQTVWELRLVPHPFLTGMTPEVTHWKLHRQGRSYAAWAAEINGIWQPLMAVLIRLVGSWGLGQCSICPVQGKHWHRQSCPR